MCFARARIFVFILNLQLGARQAQSHQAIADMDHAFKPTRIRCVRKMAAVPITLVVSIMLPHRSYIIHRHQRYSNDDIPIFMVSVSVFVCALVYFVE